MADETKQATGPGTFMWNELATRDLEAAKKFYGELLDWTYDEQEMGPGAKYYIIKSGEQQVGGILPMTGDTWGEMPSHWMGYIQVDDTRAIAERAGDAVKVKPFETPVGVIAVLADPSGAVLSILAPAHPEEAKPPAKGPGSFMWNELMSRDIEAAKEFLCGLFDWTIEEWPMGDAGTYFLLRRGEMHVGGAMAMPKEVPEKVPSHWLGYVHVADVDATAAKTAEIGGTVLSPPMDIPDVGRFATLQDPTGAAFAVMTPAAPKEK